jgi:hypothetical protein
MRGFVVLVWNTSTGAIVSAIRYATEVQAQNAQAQAKLIANQDARVLEGY